MITQNMGKVRVPASDVARGSSRCDTEESDRVCREFFAWSSLPYREIAPSPPRGLQAPQTAGALACVPTVAAPPPLQNAPVAAPNAQLVPACLRGLCYGVLIAASTAVAGTMFTLTVPAFGAVYFGSMAMALVAQQIQRN